MHAMEHSQAPGHSHFTQSPAPPTDPFLWRESVLSTRSLSYVSTMSAADDLSGPGPGPGQDSGLRRLSRVTSYFGSLVNARKNTLTSIPALDEDQDLDPLDMRPPQTQAGRDVEQMAMDEHDEHDVEQGERDELPASVARSPLFKLPPELRQLIFSYALSPSSSAAPDIPWPSTHLAAHLQPQLLRVCKPVYDEAAVILYTTTNLLFTHPSDANMFRRALASPLHAPLLPHFTIAVRSIDYKLWTAWFNSRIDERSLVRDFPDCRSLTVRYSGLRWDARYDENGNAHMWLKDPKLQEIVLSVRKCGGVGGAATREGPLSARSRDPVMKGPPVIRVVLCVHLPEDVRKTLPDRINKHLEAERCNAVIFLREAWLLGCYVRVEVMRG